MAWVYNTITTPTNCFLKSGSSLEFPTESSPNCVQSGCAHVVFLIRFSFYDHACQTASKHDSGLALQVIVQGLGQGFRSQLSTSVT